jgi:sulfite exporter TauE/SafE
MGFQLAYHFARLVGYLILGGLIFALGRQVVTTEWMPSLQIASAVLMGAMFILMGLHYLRSDAGGGGSGARVGVAKSSRWSRWTVKLSTWTQGLWRWAFRLHGWPRAVSMGFATALLPCGWLYSFILLALAQEDALRGSIVLVFFWLGTLPALTAGSVGLQALLKRYHQRAYRIIGVLFIVVGLLTFHNRVQKPLPGNSVSPSAASCH